MLICGSVSVSHTVAHRARHLKWLLNVLYNFFRFGLEFGFTDPPCGDVGAPRPPEWWYHWVKDIHYLHFGVILFAISGVVSIIVSLVTPPIPEENL